LSEDLTRALNSSTLNRRSRQHKAAKKIQAVLKGFNARRRVGRKKAATTLQNAINILLRKRSSKSVSI
jgi:hypothetical protein